MIFQAIVLGIVQGLAEFIPISSSAHLLLIQKFFHWNEIGLSFDVALHWGTLVALLAYFWSDWVNIITGFVKKVSGSTPKNGYRGDDAEGRLLIPIIIGTIPAAIAGVLIEKRLEAHPPSWYYVAALMAGMGLLMLISERVGKKIRTIDRMNWTDYIIIGIAQAFALFPGVSRSGVTITAGLFRNLDRAAAARFSFLLSTPAVFGAGLMMIHKLRKEGGLPPGQAPAYVVGFIVSAIVGYLSIRFLMNYLRSKPLNLFVWYRFAFAAVVTVAFLVR